MEGILGLKFRMYLVIALVFAIGFGVIYAFMLYFGFSTIFIVGIAALFFIAQWLISPKLIAWASKLRYLKDDEYPDLQRMVTELAKGANVPRPRVAISEATDPNAFVFGRTRKSSTLVVHKGLLNLLNNKGEIRAVLAHEIGHLKHNDSAVITFVSFVPMLAYIVAENMFFSSLFGGVGGRRNNSLYLIALGAGAFVVYMFSQLLVMALSRSRESYADIYSANTTGQPEHLASALVKITNNDMINHSTTRQHRGASSSVRALYFLDTYSVGKDVKELKMHANEIKRLLPDLDIDMLIKRAERDSRGITSALSLFSTHPSLYRRLITLSEIKLSEIER